MDWNYVTYLARPYIENPSMKVVNANISQDENGIVTIVVHIAPVVEQEPQPKEVYAEGRL